MKDHELAQFVNRLTAIAKSFGQTQQLRERIAEEVGKTLQLGHHAPRTMQIAPFCIGKKCSCLPGNCAEAGMRPNDSVTVHVDDHSIAPIQTDGVAAIHERRSILLGAMRDKLRKARNDQNAAVLRHLDDDTVYGTPKPP